MNRRIKIIISYFILGLVTVFTYLLIINVSSKSLYNPIYIKKELSHISVTEIINSSIFDDNPKMQNIRKDLNSLYSVADILDIPRDKITGLINSKISTDVITRIVINITDTLITGNKKALFDINDYNKIVDDNLELILNEKNVQLSSDEKKLLSKILKEVGEKIIKDVPSTELVLDKVDGNTLDIIRILISKQFKYFLIVMDIILLIILICLNLNRNIFKYLLYSLFLLLALLLVTSILIYHIANIFNNEWLFIKRFILYFNYNIIMSMLYILVFIIILFVIRCIMKRKA